MQNLLSSDSDTPKNSAQFWYEIVEILNIPNKPKSYATYEIEFAQKFRKQISSWVN